MVPMIKGLLAVSLRKKRERQQEEKPNDLLEVPPGDVVAVLQTAMSGLFLCFLGFEKSFRPLSK